MIQFSDMLDVLESNPFVLTSMKNNYLKMFNCSTEMTDDFFLLQVKKVSTCGSILIAYSKIDNFEIDILASAKLIIEPKITLGNNCIGRIEDMEFCNKYRNTSLMYVLLYKLKTLAKSLNCTELLLNCVHEDKSKYEKYGFQQKYIQMSSEIENVQDFSIGDGQIGVSPVDPSCNHCLSIIQRNGFLSIGDFQDINKLNLFIRFISLHEKEDFDEVLEKNKVLDALTTNVKLDYKLLIIVQVVDLMQKYKIASNDGVLFLYMSSISPYNGFGFEWKKDNDFLDKVLNEKIIKNYYQT